MKNIALLFYLVCYTGLLFGQNTLQVIIRDLESKAPLVGATAVVDGTNLGAVTNGEGLLEIVDIPDGKQTLVFSYLGYESRQQVFLFPLDIPLPVEVWLTMEEEELEEVIITSTRSTRTIENIPTRVEFIAGEELEEKGNMKPGDIRMMLNESTGIQTQQTSATSYNSSIRIQGLDGKYTQVLRDGLPLYGGFSGGLSLLQIAPLDLKQVEVIKGATSTLYGGGAIAGLVNLVSKTPEASRELSFMLNGTSALGLDASAFYAQKFNKVGATVFAAYNLGSPYDPAGIGLTAIPKFNRYTLNPRLFFYVDDKTTINIGFNSTVEDRMGGDIKYIKGTGGPQHTYFERNKTNRFSTQFGFDRVLGEQVRLSAKNSVSRYDRSIEVPDYQFSGVQLASFSEINLSVQRELSEWVGGVNLWTDRFSQQAVDRPGDLDYQFTTVGAFLQHTLNASAQFSVETGLRGDYHDKYGFFVLPRVSGLLRVNNKLSLRLGGGMGYKAPTVFIEDAERLQFRGVLPIDQENSRAEKSLGGNFDINYRTPLSDHLFFTLNALIFYTRVQDPLTLVPVSDDFFEFQQPAGFVDSKGIESNIKLTYGDFKLFIGYTLADVQQHYTTRTDFPLVARHRLNNVLMYELEERLKIGLEAYYFSPQKLNDGTTGRQYWIAGLMMEKIWEGFSVFLNFENFLDTRQTRFDSIYTGSLSNPVFRDIYAPVDGFVVNGGFKFRL